MNNDEVHDLEDDSISRIIDYYDTFLNHQEYIAVLDSNLNILICSEKNFSLYNLPKSTNQRLNLREIIIDKYGSEFAINAINAFESLIQLCTKSNKTQSFISISPNRDSESMCLYTQIMPICNHKSKRVIAFEVKSTSLINALKVNIENVFMSSDNLKRDKSFNMKVIYTKFSELTEKESEILFLMQENIPIKLYAEILLNSRKMKISQSTIYNTIHYRLMPKFDCYNVSELLYITQKVKYFKSIPRSLVTSELIINIQNVC